ncbi:MAG: Rne/Rng family ribonuclease [Planktomarina temperata]|jgi:ribonuclease E|uniref:Rne/Rng family ribonuclease n=3 Tax=Paracoccaceae TaxID=31989 RepID=UPI00231EC09D|nr:Rne/Rng family ribonuclease [Planktomarina temperata]MDA9940774.1 Rne/Rng family ribonuclease [Planktomarina temperata]MDB2466914.1 Rne/Rng family ribonuclease [Planktomarina temperata]MDB2605351.1 Rne/Rng family ribonuclease [Planktomarina temperata]MDB4854685.1 Rne/Rng family ribonuclease [Planktomarina temperata]
MAKKMLIDATHAEETRVVVVDGNKVEEFDFESQNKRQIAGNIYLAKVTRVEPSLQAAFVDYGGNRHGFLAFSEIHPDYYQIPVADREALMAEEKAYAEAMAAEAEQEAQKPKRTRKRRAKPAAQHSADPIETRDVTAVDGVVDGMETIDLSADEEGQAAAPLLEDNLSEAAPDAEDANETAEVAPESEPASAGSEEVVEPEAALDTAEDPDQEDEDQADDGIESVAQEDDSEDVRPVRKPRPRRYKIQEVIKVRQIMLIQVVKEERGNKGAALTTYLSLAGRYCVLMPNTARGGGISRKITNAADRKKLKEIATTIVVPEGAGLIVRTAGAKRTKTEIKRDYEYLQRMWEQIRELTLKSSAPSAIYEEGDLIKRSIRDLYNRDIDEVLVEGAAGYRNAKDTMKMIMPSHAKNVKHYMDSMPLFARFQVETFMDGMFNPTVQLKSGGYLVIGITEALVAIDVNSGRATKEGSIEQTALNTNLEAAEEVARQLRLRDLAGLIVIDFIDMDERRNNIAVEKRMKDKLQSDRARIQVGRISGFGLMEMSRQRLRPGMLEASTQPCAHCHGTGLIRSQDSLGLTILRELEEEGGRARSKEVLIKAPISIANFLINQKREHISQIEQRHGMAVRIEADPFLISPDYTIEKFKTATRIVPANSTTVSSVDFALMEEIDEQGQEDDQADVIEAVETPEDGDAPKKRRRRRRRRRGGSDALSGDQSQEDGSQDEASPDAPAVESDGEGDKPKRRRRTRGGAKAKPVEENPQDRSEELSEAGEVAVAAPPEPVADAQDVAVVAEAAPAEKPKRVRKPRKTKAQREAEEAAAAQTTAPIAAVEEAVVAEEAAPEVAVEKPAAKPKRVRKPAAKKAVAVEETPADAPAPEAVEPSPVPEAVAAPVAQADPAPLAAEPEPEKPAAPKKRGWWSRG